MALVFQSHTLGQGDYCCYTPCFPYSASGAACAPGFVVRCVATFRPGSILNISPSLLSRPFLGGAGQKWLIRHCKPHLQKQLHKLTVTDAAAPKDGVKWWEKEGAPNMYDIHTTQDFVDQLANAGDKLVVAEFYATWCGSCRALYPKLCKLAEENANVVFLKVNFDENKPMCKRLNVRVLPYFHFYRGADGRLDGFSCSLAKLQKLRDAIALHNTDRCSIGPPLGAGDIDLLSLINTTDKPAPAGVS